VIGLGPHTMTTGFWVFVALLQLGLIVAAVLAVWLAAGRPRPPRRHRRASRDASMRLARSTR
jgi:hypothetical protein